MRIALTGATGFIGSHIAESLTRQGHIVTALVRTGSRTDFLKSLGVAIKPAELHDRNGLVRALHDHDAIIHAAAKVDTYGFWRDFERTTVAGTRNVVQAATDAGVRRFVHISSVGVYGWPRADGTPFVETDPYGTPYRWNYYSRSKIAAEKTVQTATIETTILRLTWVFGPRDPTTLGRLVRALRERRVRWIGTADNVLDLVYASDMADAVVLASTNPKAAGQIYNVSARESSATQREYVTAICEQLNLPLPKKTLSPRFAAGLGFLSECIAHATAYRVRPPLTRHTFMLFGGQRRYSTDKIRADLGWTPRVDFATGIRQTLTCQPA
ncbi:MAG: 2-alkyl-3-oxoalkanoate reductase [Verrucomicrobiae bacterium]|nr:2-alkyl-3-oxoalkanoate reductase [Verrucomicrobiae bacterium]